MKTAVAALFASALLVRIQAAEPPSRYAEVDGLRVHYQTLGKGKPAVAFIHGWTCDLTFWRLQAPAAARKHQVLLIDLPGHGRSDKPQVDYTLSLFARSVDAVLRDAGVDKAVLVGHSMGGPVALKFLRLYPAKVAGFVSVDSRIFQPPPDPAEAEKRAAQFASFLQQFRGPDYKAAAGRMIDSMFVPATTPALREEIKSKMLAAPQHVMLSALEGMRELSTWKTERVDVPTLAVFAPGPILTPEAKKFAHTFVPRLDYQVWDGAGHFLMMEKPEEFNQALAKFLDGL